MASAGKNRNAKQGESIEQYRARQRGDGADHTPDEWFDVLDGWQPIEVKSTQRTLASGRKGRFRLWRNQHDGMTEQGGEYDFAVIDDDKVWKETTVSADRVSEIIDENDLSWTAAGRHGMPTEQVKIPWNYVIES